MNSLSDFKERYYDDEDLYGSDESDRESRMKETRRRSKSVPQEKVNDVMVDTFIWLVTIYISGGSKDGPETRAPSQSKLFEFHAFYVKILQNK